MLLYLSKYNFEKILIGILLIIIPFQSRLIVYGYNWSFNEWLSFSIYLSDVLIFFLIAYWVYRNGLRDLVSNKYTKSLWLFVVWSGLSIFWAINYQIGVLNLIRLIEFGLLFLYLSNYVYVRFGLEFIAKSLVLSGVIQSIIGIIQYLIQKDIGLRLLGESVIGPYITGTASFVMANGDKIIRSYGLTPHSNIYSAFILIAILSLIWLLIKGFKSNWLILSIPVLIFGIGFGFSRSILFGLLVVFIIFLVKSFNNKDLRKPILVFILSGVLFVCFQYDEVINRIRLNPDDESVAMREFYNQEATSGDLVLIGSGIGNFVPWLMNEVPSLTRSLYQPVHNLYLLIYREIGVIGLLIWLSFLFYLFRYSNNLNFKILFGLIIFLALFDHYWLTTQQGRFMLWFALSLLTIREEGI